MNCFIIYDGERTNYSYFGTINNSTNILVASVLQALFSVKICSSFSS